MQEGQPDTHSAHPKLRHYARLADNQPSYDLLFGRRRVYGDRARTSSKSRDGSHPAFTSVYSAYMRKHRPRVPKGRRASHLTREQIKARNVGGARFKFGFRKKRPRRRKRAVKDPEPDYEGAELEGSAFNLDAKQLNFTSPDPALAKCVEDGVHEERTTHFDCE